MKRKSFLCDNSRHIYGHPIYVFLYFLFIPILHKGKRCFAWDKQKIEEELNAARLACFPSFFNFALVGIFLFASPRHLSGYLGCAGPAPIPIADVSGSSLG
jgi:hypothetical protein